MKRSTLAAASAATLALAACGSPAEETAVAADDPMMADRTTNTDVATTDDILQVAQSRPEFSMLVQAGQMAGLTETLSGPGPYTIFAPTNAAFDRVPQTTRDQLMSESGRSDLANVLQYHVVEGRVDAAALQRAIQGAGEEGYTLDTLSGGTLEARMDGGNVVLTDAAGKTVTVTQTDLEASNGVIHTVDGVLMPS